MLNELDRPTRRCTREQTRERILAKAAELFRSLGYAKTTVADIAAGLDMSPANIYLFFPCKEAIIQVGAERLLSGLIKTIEAKASSLGNALDRIESVVVTVSKWNSECLRGEPQSFRLVLVANAHHWSCAREFRKFLLKTMTDLIGEGVESGEFHVSDPAAAAQVLADCLERALSPSISQAPTNQLTEERVRAQVRFLGRALR